MLKFIASRLLQSLLVLLITITVTFFMVRNAKGDPFSADRRMPEHIKARLMEHYGLDQPQWVQFQNYLSNLLLRGDFGPSFVETRNVNQILAAALPVSLELGVIALLVALSIGLPIGILAAVRKNTLLDYMPMSVAMVGICLPTFVLGPMLAMVFGVWLGWLNVAGWFLPEDRILPAATLGIVYGAIIARITRGGMLEVLSQDFVRTAKAKGVSGTRIVWRHCLKGGLIPVVSFMGPALAGIISGSFVIETIFAIPGMGRKFVESAFNRDYTLVLGTVIVYAVLIALCNLLADIAEVVMNPRRKFED